MTGAPCFRMSLLSNPPVCVKDRLVGTSGGFSKFVLLSKFAYDDLLLKSNPTNSPNSSSLANTALKEIGQTDSEIVSKLSVTNALVGSPADLDSQLKTVSGGVEQADPGLSAVKSASELIIHE